VDFALKPSVVVVSCFDLSSVSILVLVDFALKLMKVETKKDPWYSFNPCFGGFCFKTVQVDFIPDGTSIMFQSLFWWILL